MSKFKVLFQLTGSISCFKAAQVISTLVQNNFEVKCVASQSALKFIGEATLEGLTGHPVFKDSYESGRMMDHIELARWADLFVLCPATANTLNKLSAGIADDVIGQIFLASGMKKPYLVFPAMNKEMYAHPATQASLKKLKSWGIQVMATGEGHQACGEVGEGRLLEPQDIFRKIKSLSNKRSNNSLKILITAGGTRENIDGVRFITNTSTGKTAAKLADSFLGNGHHVTYVAGVSAERPTTETDVLEFSDFNSLSHILKAELKKTYYDVIIHAAAVADYSVSKIVSGQKTLSSKKDLLKIDSDSKTLSLELKKNKKIINELKSWSPKSYVVAFKLTNGASTKEAVQAVEKLATESHSDLVVHNDFSQLQSKDERVFSIYEQSNFKNPTLAHNTEQLAQRLLERSENDLSP